MIIDTNVACEILVKRLWPEVTRRLFGRQSRPLVISIGGRLRNEYLKSPDLTRAVRGLLRNGRAIVIDEREVAKERETIRRRCRSNDVDIIALARAGKSRVLASKDEALCEDFLDRSLVGRPRGRICKNINIHGRMLDEEARRFA